MLLGVYFTDPANGPINIPVSFFLKTCTWPLGALIAAAPMGKIGGVAQAALSDLAIRSRPKNLQGAMMMLFGISIYWAAGRFGDRFGAEIYDRHGGFIPAGVATILASALILPGLLLAPRRLIATSDGEAMPLAPWQGLRGAGSPRGSNAGS